MKLERIVMYSNDCEWVLLFTSNLSISSSYACICFLPELTDIEAGDVGYIAQSDFPLVTLRCYTRLRIRMEDTGGTIARRMRATTEAFLQTWTGDWVDALEANLALRAPECSHTILPSSLGRKDESNVVWASKFSKVMSLITESTVCLPTELVVKKHVLTLVIDDSRRLHQRSRRETGSRSFLSESPESCRIIRE